LLQQSYKLKVIKILFDVLMIFSFFFVHIIFIMINDDTLVAQTLKSETDRHEKDADASVFGLVFSAGAG